MVHQRDLGERRKFITFMILPHNSMREVFRLNLPRWLAVTLGVFLGLIITLVIVFFLYSSYIAGRLLHYYALQAENRTQATQIKVFYNKTKELETGIRELEERDQELRELLGLKKAPLRKPKSGGELINDLPREISQNIASLSEYIAAKKLELVMFRDIGSTLVAQFNNIPSESPVPGTVWSRYGFRTHPFSGKTEFHSGSDIPIWTGCPIKSTADGYVTFSGWDNGFGNVVIIDHQNGYRTIYGHNHRNLVKRGDRIKKGQVIAQAGSTGISTGPHVHYQVEYRNRTLNPENFLNLNIRSARLLQ
ncbi:MAG: M23 family metallopeptidase [Candidatus Margulisbacteria bacterium]|jgi:murein DD-endopeptidase MepM/ murein hydrolase activator NlpD|nr:M23 family metallopeptidase [Candidatus Margulisiibacteriota bacterium]